MTTTTAEVAVELTIERFDRSGGDARYSGMRGTRVEAETGYTSSRVFSTHFPPVYVADSGDVEIGDELLVPIAEALAWLRAVADHIEARMDAS